jgi:hypothetical protein
VLSRMEVPTMFLHKILNLTSCRTAELLFKKTYHFKLTLSICYSGYFQVVSVSGGYDFMFSVT